MPAYEKPICGRISTSKIGYQENFNYGNHVQANSSFFMQGIKALSIIFTTDGELQKRGFQLQISPIKNKCQCKSGTPKSNHNCFDDNLQDCSSCTNNFYLTNETNPLSRWYKGSSDDLLAKKQVCKPNQCNCENGTAVKNEFCKEHESNQCQFCDPGFYFVPNNETCIQCECFDLNNAKCVDISYSGNDNIICSTGNGDRLCFGNSNNLGDWYRPDWSFDECQSQTELDLSSKMIGWIPEFYFVDSVNLQILRLNLNSLGSFPARSFDNNNELRILDLNSNRIMNPDANSFSTLTKLSELYFGYQLFGLINLPVGLFDNNIELTTLKLHDNQIKNLHAKSFSTLIKLTGLILLKNLLNTPSGRQRCGVPPAGMFRDVFGRDVCPHQRRPSDRRKRHPER